MYMVKLVVHYPTCNIGYKSSIKGLLFGIKVQRRQENECLRAPRAKRANEYQCESH
jgi:hypothetical protein